MVVVLCYLMIGLESPLLTLCHKFTKNTIFRIQLVIQLLIIIAYYALASTVFLGESNSQRKSYNYYYPRYDVWLLALAGLVVIALFEELTKMTIRKLFDRDHSRLRIFFSTKLGMWSPR
jgi:bacteriorhodopsin